MNEKYRARLTKLKSNFPGPLSGTEYNYLVNIQDLIKAAQERKFNFIMVLRTIMEDIRLLARHNGKLDNLLDEGFALSVIEELVVLDEAELHGNDVQVAEPLNASENKFLSDINGMIGFTLKNGVGFHFPLNILFHDIIEVLSFDGSIEKALEACFKPKSTGWAEIDESSFGEAEEA